MRAARFLVAHNVAYQHLSVNEEEARAQFAEVGGTCEAVRAQATPVEAEHQVPFKLSGPADTDMGGDSTFPVGEAEVAREENVENNYKPDEENPFEEVAEDLPGFRCAAGEVGSSDLDVERCFREFAAKLKLLMSRQQGRERTMDFDAEVESFRRLAESMSSAELQAKLDALVAQMDSTQGATESPDLKTVQVVHTASKPLSMYSAEYWQKCFPELFPYGDGVYGLVRDAPLTFREWAGYLLERAELEYDAVDPTDIAPEDQSTGNQAGVPGSGSFQPPAVPRWCADLNFVAVACDTWKRMEMVRLASAHVKRKKFKESLKTVLQCTSDRLSRAMLSLGEYATIADVMRSSIVDERIRDAISQLLFFSAEVIGTDGARQQLRHEQNGAMLMYLDSANVYNRCSLLLSYAFFLDVPDALCFC